MKTLLYFTIKYEKKIFYSLIVFILLLGTYNSFIQDDAFISFRYAHNFANGHGLDWNIDTADHVEGYTNFLWVLLLSVVEYLNLDPIVSSKVIGLIFSFGTLLFTYRLTLLIFQSKYLALLSIFFLGTNYSYSAYITGGLETQLQVFLVVANAFYIFYVIDNKKLSDGFLLLAISLLFTLSILTRLDTIMISGIFFTYLLLSLYKEQLQTIEKIKSFIILILPSLVILSTWFVLKYNYYGDFLPNTFYVKATHFSLKTFIYGGAYLIYFLNGYFLTPFLLIGIWYFKELIVEHNIKIMVLIIIIWCLYIIKIGGDFMEFRFMVPILPFIFIVVLRIILFFKTSSIQIFLILIIPIASLYHAMTFKGAHGIESIHTLNYHIVNPKENWEGIGKKLGQIFSVSSSNPIVIAVTAAGAIPYYSNLNTIDMFGLNDKWIAKNGIHIGSRPGHSIHTTLEYLLKSKVNLVIGQPKVLPISAEPELNPESYFLIEIDKKLLPKETRVIEIPIDSQYKIDILYIIKHPEIEKCIKRYKLKTYKIFKGAHSELSTDSGSD